MRKSILIILLVALCTGCTLPISLMDPEFYECYRFDYMHRKELGLLNYIHIDNNVSKYEFLNLYQKYGYPGSKLDGPYYAGEDFFGGPPKISGYSYVYFIIDSTGCPIYRYFFQKNDVLIRMESMYQEFGFYNYHDFYGYPHVRKKKNTPYQGNLR